MNITYKNLKVIFERFNKNLSIVKNLKNKTINIKIEDSGTLIININKQTITGFVKNNDGDTTKVFIDFKNDIDAMYNYVLMRVSNIFSLQKYKNEFDIIEFEDIFQDETYSCLLSEYAKQCFIPLNDFYYNIIFTIGNTKDIAECLDVSIKNIKIIKRDSRRALIKHIIGEI
jgi:hypothetical protein